ncbi:translation initiation factor eIF-2 beta subunit [Malassezia yamatoensis]|uniref:Translation initiation factor eIF-2 beta subunit n=1 Tax=Malassezia yamatoensis TaxID=253288 RepID=A0AAJ5YWU0_9BASI|nr:translation initiation factor eIF-2 beta subunit [Malassezia yamatoensis]
MSTELDKKDTMASTPDAPQQEAAQDANDLFGGLKKKSGKKKKIPMTMDFGEAEKKTESPTTETQREPEAQDSSAAAAPVEQKQDTEKPSVQEDDEAPAEGNALDVCTLLLTQFGEMKKKKKKKKKTAFDLEEFEKELGEQRDSDNPDEDPENPFAAEKDEEALAGKTEDVEAWQGTDRDYTYQELLGRIFRTLRLQNPSLSGEKKKYTMVPPVVQRDGSKKTVFANVLEICKRMHRQPDHVIQYLFTELGTVGSVDGSQRLVIRGRFQPKQIENVLRRYIVEYVTCKTCRSPNTLLTKENRIYFMTCEACGSQRSVSAIKTGFQAQTGKRSKMRQ